MRTAAVWKPPLEPAVLQDMLDRLRSWTPLDVDTLLDDIAEALNVAPPAASETARLVRRFCRALPQLVGIAVASGEWRKHAYVAVLVQRARHLVEQVDLDADRYAAALLEQTAWCCHELLDQLVSTGCVTGVAA